MSRWLSQFESDKPRRLLLLSGEQILPNLQAILAMMEGDLLQAVHVACTTDEDRSVRPARALKRLLSTLEPDLFQAQRSPDFHIDVLDDAQRDPAAVHDWALALARQHPDALWVANVTGALKPMSFGLRDFLQSASGAGLEAVGLYLERADGWSQIVATPGTLQHRPLDPKFRNDLVAKVPIKEIVGAHLHQGTVSVKATPRSDVDIVALTQALVESGWNWRQVFSDFGIAADQQGDGFHFESWVLHLLDALGADQVVGNLEVRDRETTLIESDVVCLHNGNIALLDLKLSTEDEAKTPPSEQVRSTSTTARKLGGLGASMLILRPSWRQQEDNQYKAVYDLATALNVRVLNAAAGWNLAGKLKQVLRLPDEKNVAERIDGLLERSLLREGFAIARPMDKKTGRELPVTARPEQGSDAINLDEIVGRYAPASIRNWQRVRICNTEMLYVCRPQSGMPGDALDLMQAAEGFNKLFRFEKHTAGFAMLASKGEGMSVKALCKSLEARGVSHLEIPPPPNPTADRNGPYKSRQGNRRL